MNRTVPDRCRARRGVLGAPPSPLPVLLALLALALGSAAAVGDPLGLDLAGAVDLALANDELLQQAAEAVRSAEAEALAAGSDRLPQLDLGAQWTANLVKPAFFLPPDLAAGFGGATKVEMGRDHSLQGAVTLTWTLWTAGRLSAATGAARELVAAGRWRQEAVADAVRFQATAAYLDALLAAERVRIAEEALATTAEALRQARAGYDQGTVSRFDLLRAEVELANREVPLLQARNARRQAELALLRLCGLPADAAPVLTDALALVGIPAEAAADPAVIDRLVRTMRERSPELHALRHRVAAARQAVCLARAARGPVLQAHGRYGLQAEWDNDIAPAAEERATSAGAGLSLAIPIFDGWRTRAGIRDAAARLRQAELELARLDGDRELAVRQAGLQLASALSALSGRRESVDLAAEAYRLAEVRLQEGLATALDRLDAELALTRARVQLAESLHACHLARAAVALAVGADPATALAADPAAADQEDLR